MKHLKIKVREDHISSVIVWKVASKIFSIKSHNVFWGLYSHVSATVAAVTWWCWPQKP
jgi:hypothetical protein